MVAPIISGMQGVENQKIDPHFEHLCGAHYLGGVDSQTVQALLLMWAEKAQYYNLIGREVNLRWRDATGPRQDPWPWRYWRRIFSREEGDSIGERIQRENLALQIMSHIILPCADPLFAAFGNRLKFIEMVRHPLYMIDHWLSYLPRMNSSREFTLAVDFEGKKVPWFAAEWADRFLSASIPERAVLSIAYLYREVFDKIDKYKDQTERLLILSFEDIVFQTDQELDKLKNFLGRSHHPQLHVILKKQKLPRKIISQGKGYATYNWQAGVERDEAEAFDKLLIKHKSSLSRDVWEQFLLLILDYNKRWPSLLAEFKL